MSLKGEEDDVEGAILFLLLKHGFKKNPIFIFVTVSGIKFD